jgi:hypothetical protein
MAIRESYAELQKPTSKQNIPLPDFDQVINKLGLYSTELYFGTMTGTGASLDSPTLPFDPAMVLVINQTQVAWFLKLPTMADDDTAKTVTAGTFTYDAAGCITLGTKKFTLGTDAQINTASDVIHFVAWGQKGKGGSS